MGMRFRKSFGGKGFRVNVSKSGVGFSMGGKGFRYTKKAGGGTRTTASLPGTGISYVKDSKKGKKRTSTSSTSGRVVERHNYAVDVYDYVVSTKKSVFWNKLAYWVMLLCWLPMILLGLLLALVEPIGWLFVGIGAIEVFAKKHFKNKYKQLEAELSAVVNDGEQ